ncbi:hypothetical protein EDB87DRAFT_1576431 [Lactarius vividus]|nr:hypothetical protein EDB87DRAFT_1576431 [Lactarius vividus]
MPTLVREEISYASTSDTPTFPYTTKQREEIIDLLEHNKVNWFTADCTHSSYITTYVTGLWTTVDSKWGVLLAIILNTLLFGFPDGYQARFKSLWLDQLINTSHWCEHTSETVEDLKQMASLMLALIIANVHMMPLFSFPAFSSSSLLLCILGIVTALFLMQEQRRLLSTNTITASATGIVHLGIIPVSNAGLLDDLHWSPPFILLATFLSVATTLVILCGGIWKALHPHPKTFQDLTQSVPIPSLIPPVDQIENLTANTNI